MSDDIELPTPDAGRAKARRDYPQFYLLASPEEESLMDGLALAHVTLRENFQVPRRFLPPSLRPEVEKMTDAFERLFTVLREAVRSSSAYAKIDDAERAKIERELFEISAPEHEA